MQLLPQLLLPVRLLLRRPRLLVAPVQRRHVPHLAGLVPQRPVERAQPQTVPPPHVPHMPEPALLNPPLVVHVPPPVHLNN
ncbi:MAG: hypothetical protein ABJP02_13725 [Parasphingorhabdus sp.]|uniref:hypothetical protein n=1 Tax=Parasphingorhabdus sp. TaxID=2709688 RepID=UPI003297A28E